MEAGAVYIPTPTETSFLPPRGFHNLPRMTTQKDPEKGYLVEAFIITRGTWLSECMTAASLRPPPQYG